MNIIANEAVNPYKKRNIAADKKSHTTSDKTISINKA